MEAVLDSQSKSLTITSDLILYGTASPALAKRIAADIQNAWNAPGARVTLGGLPYVVRFIITGRYVPAWQAWMMLKLNRSKRNLFVRVEEKTNNSMAGISYWDGDGNTGEFRLSDILPPDSTTAAHEYGHGMGLLHPHKLDIRDPSATAGKKGGTLNPAHRKVRQEDIDALHLEQRLGSGNTVELGGMSNVFHARAGS